MHVILDWVANHTAWDNPLVDRAPRVVRARLEGRLPPDVLVDWADIIDLDYGQPGLRRYMTEAMKYWVREADIDGYRCDVAGFVPLDFWNNVRRELDAIKPVFMLAEWEARDLHAEAFDATYAWSWYDRCTRGRDGQARTSARCAATTPGTTVRYPRDAMRMTFVSNHDKNAWEGTEFEQFGDGLEAAIVLSVVGEGMPLIYNGQEAGNDRRLAFFERTRSRGSEHPNGELYRQLFALKKANTALWNAHWGARMIDVPNTAPDKVLSFVRANEHDKVFAVFNFSGSPVRVGFADALFTGRYDEFATGRATALAEGARLELPAWGYRVFVQ